MNKIYLIGLVILFIIFVSCGNCLIFEVKGNVIVVVVLDIEIVDYNICFSESNVKG